MRDYIWWSSDRIVVVPPLDVLTNFLTLNLPLSVPLPLSPPSSLLLLLLFHFTTFAESQIINQPPHFVSGSGDMARFSLSENTPVGSPVYQLKGADPEGSRLKYSISGPVFSVDRESGVVRLRQELDRETQNIIEVIISITDESIYGTEPNTVSLRREIPVRDYNDNAPTFLGRPYSASVSEATVVGTEIPVSPNIIVIDRDEGINSELQINCFQENGICDTFEVTAERISDGNFTARLTLKKPLDFESRPSYIMTVAASDGAIENRLTAFASVSVNVIDVQDQPPIFTNAPYSASVEENTPAGFSVLTIKAIDGDVGIPRDIFLSLEDEDGGHFELAPFGDPKDGNAVLQTTGVLLDRENNDILQNGGVYVFTVRATELIDGEIPSDFATTRVTIVVMDTDDHLPEFNSDFFNISIPENLNKGMPLPGLSVFVDDKDLGENSRYELSLREPANMTKIFAVSPVEAQGRTPVVLKVLNSSKLDYDVDDPKSRIFEFDLIASVKGVERASTHIRVELSDVNDNFPIFEQSTYRFRAPENLTLNSKIGEVQATDKDSNEFGKVSYVLKGFGTDNFYVNPETGGFFIQKPLNYEKQSSYSLSIVAVDGGDRETNANVYVEVIDVNDNYPIFESSEYTRTIRESATSFEPQFFIRANDYDGPMQGGGRVRYAIVSENSISGNVFRINEETGEIMLQKTAKSMDTEKGEYELIVSATDFGTPPLTNTTRVLIRVGISGNQRPIFRGHFQNIENVPVLGPPSYRVSIPENAKAGDNITTVSAHDPDGLDTLLRYRIVGANDNFEIDERSGLITVSPYAHIDRDSHMDSFEITVNAVDSGTPIPETATTTVYVSIKDINDERPKFEHSNYAGYVSERTDIGEGVLKVKAIDKDLNSNLEYKIKGLVRATSKAGVALSDKIKYNVQDVFRVNASSGEVFVNGPLQHDVAAVIMFTIEVRDLNAEINPQEQTDTTEVIVYVQSFKDTNPVFKNKGWTSSKPVINVRIKEEMPIDSVLFILQAEDPVTKQPISGFELVEPAELDYLQVHERSGEVILRKRLDYEMLRSDQTNYEFQVRAQSGDGQRTSITRVNITIENVNDNSPIFEESSYRATILENSQYPAKIIQVRATDKDASLTERDERLGYHRVVYSLHGENAGLLMINNRTGEITVAPNQIIDREQTPHLHLQIKAEDSPGKPIDAKQSLVKLTVDVIDVNDNIPEFTQKNYTAVIPENAPVDSFVMKVFAIDSDEGPGGEVHYELINENEIKGLFKLNPKTGELKTKRQLTGKGRSASYQLSVRARDNGNQLPKQESLSSEAIIQLYVGDVSANDGIPYFVSPKVGQIANITENSPIGSVVFQLIAADPYDTSTPSGTLFYRIQNDSLDGEHFRIDENSGLITTLTVLDREEKSLYNLILEVFDDGQPRQSAQRILQIEVLDVDDHEPRFVREVDEGPVGFSVLEEAPGGTIVGNLSALDEDIGENAAIDYAIIDGNTEDAFDIEVLNGSIATIKTKRPIDRETIDSYMLTIKCLKMGAANYSFIGDKYDRYDHSHLQVRVKIVDIDDNLPQFERRDSSIGIRINVPIDTVITTVHATDLDAEALPIFLTIQNVTFVPQFYKRTRKFDTSTEKRLFSLNNRTGELRTGGSFADYVDGYFQLKIRANNSENEKRHTFNQLKIFVIRDKSLLKFVFARPPNEIQSIIQPFQDQLQQRLKSHHMELHILDTQVLTRSDMSLDFSSTSSCFQMFKNGVAMPLHEMQTLMDSALMRLELLDIYVEYGVSEVESCSARRSQAGVNMLVSPGTWLVILAALIGVAAIIAACTACCLKKKYKKYTKRNVNSVRTPTEPYGVGVPAVFYSEPIYGPL